MKAATVSRALPLLAMALLPGCGGKQGTADTPGSSGASSASASVAPAAPVTHPFASTPLEAQSLIQEQVDSHMKTLWKCVTDYRSRAGDPHKPVVVDIGIDQEGTLLGVMGTNPKQGELEPALRDCVFGALHGLPFPRSHAGVITVRQTFTDAAVSR